jgi:hypothetical protein
MRRYASFGRAVPRTLAPPLSPAAPVVVVVGCRRLVNPVIAVFPSIPWSPSSLLFLPLFLLSSLSWSLSIVVVVVRCRCHRPLSLSLSLSLSIVVVLASRPSRCLRCSPGSHPTCYPPCEQRLAAVVGVCYLVIVALSEPKNKIKLSVS